MSYFSGVGEAGLSEAATFVLRCVRGALADARPANVDATAAFIRKESGGTDFVMPHSFFAGFGLVVRVGDSSGKAELAYSACRRPDRGDEFDAAFDARRRDLIAEVEVKADCRDLTEKLHEYLGRRLDVISELDSRTGSTVRTRILWPTPGARSEQPVLWEARHGRRLMRATEEQRSRTSFDG